MGEEKEGGGFSLRKQLLFLEGELPGKKNGEEASP